MDASSAPSAPSAPSASSASSAWSASTLSPESTAAAAGDTAHRPDSLADAAPVLTERAAQRKRAVAASHMKSTAMVASITKRPAAIRGARIVPAGVTDPCESPTSAMQTACLAQGIRRSNSRLASLYGSIVRAMRRQQRIPRAGRDPAYISQLRHAEDEWLAWRDSECTRRANGYSGKLWAVPRTQCIAEVTETRAAELDRVLQQVHQQ